MTDLFEIDEATFTVSDDLTHMEQVEKYRIAFNTLMEAEKSLKSTIVDAKKSGDRDAFFEASSKLEEISQYWLPFVQASDRAEDIVAGGHKLASTEGELAPPKEEYEPDPIVTLFLIVLDFVTQEFKDSLKEAVAQFLEEKPEFNDYMEAFVQLTPGLRVLQDLRDQIIPAGDNGEIAKIIRDPIKQPAKILKDIRNGVISKDDRSDLAVIIRDPIKQPVKKVEKLVKKIFRL